MNARAEIEATMQADFRAGRIEAVATRVLEVYGPEILGYLVACTGNQDEALEVFGTFTEDMWAGLPGFRWQASLRTWLYKVARSAKARRARKERRWQARVPISEAPPEAVRAQAKSTLPSHLDSAAQRRVAALAAQLDAEERELLLLRLDRELSWSQIARVLADEALDEAEEKRQAAALRKRYQRVKARLRERIEAERGT